MIMEMEKIILDCPGHEIHVCRRPMHTNLFLGSYLSEYGSYCLNCIHKVLTTALRVVMSTLRFWRKFDSLRARTFLRMLRVTVLMGGGDTHLGYGILGGKKSWIWDMRAKKSGIWDMGKSSGIWDMGVEIINF